MDQEDEFYITLPSNSSMKFFADNTTTKFTTHLQREIKLTGQWSVGIAEAYIPQSVIHFNREDYGYYFGRGAPYPIRYYFFTPGLYQNVENLIEEINSNKDLIGHLEIVKKDCMLEFPNISKPNLDNGYYNILKKCKCDSPHRLYFGQKFMQVLGFSYMGHDEHGFYIQSSSTPRAVDYISASLPACTARALPSQLFIYSDIAVPYNVGDTRATLLRIVSFNTSKYIYGNTSVHSFTRIHYFPVLKNSFQNISIDIRDEYGEPISFEYGTVTITLHFKRDR